VTPIRAALALALLAAPAAAAQAPAARTPAAPVETAAPAPNPSTEVLERVSALETPATKQVAEDAIGRLRSPWCPGLMLEVCPSAPAEMFRDTIHLLAAEGRGADEIVEWALARYGEEWRAVPKRSGTGLLAWLIPPAALVAGVGFVALRLRRLRRDEGPYAPAAAAPLSPEEQASLDAAMADLDRAGGEDA
jgi:cytochrome c-type biogenesis protein CcmH/NrfF